MFGGGCVEQSTAYLVMILFPVICWLFKITISYEIRYEMLKLNVDKFFKKHKSSFFNKFFYVDLKQYIPPFSYYTNFLSGCLLLLSVLLSLIYLLLAILGYKLSVEVIPKITTYISLILGAILMISGTIKTINDKFSK